MLCCSLLPFFLFFYVLIIASVSVSLFSFPFLSYFVSLARRAPWGFFFSFLIEPSGKTLFLFYHTHLSLQRKEKEKPQCTSLSAFIRIFLIYTSFSSLFSCIWNGHSI